MTTRITIIYRGRAINGMPVNKSATYISDKNPLNGIKFIVEKKLEKKYTDIKAILFEEEKYE